MRLGHVLIHLILHGHKKTLIPSPYFIITWTFLAVQNASLLLMNMKEVICSRKLYETGLDLLGPG